MIPKADHNQAVTPGELMNREAPDPRSDFPPNREIREGESVCRVCGSGKAAHILGALGHPFERQA